MNAPRTLSITRAGVIGTLVVLVVALVCVRLGFWQLDRLEQRRTRNALIQARAAQPPVTVTASTRDTTGLLDRRGVVEGRFDNDRSIVLAGRSLRGTPGVYVLTPLVLEGSGTAVLVNRGWVPSPDAASIQLDSLREPGEHHIDGLILAFPATAIRATSGVERPDSFRTVWFSIDPVKLHAQFPYPLLNLQMQALPAANTPEYPRRLEPPVLDEGPHFGYAVQWFSFATIAIVGWFAIVLRRGDPTGQDGRPGRRRNQGNGSPPPGLASQ